MILYPAIDILRRPGRAARRRATSTTATVYDDVPLEAARAWVEAGARFLHIVDLDGAKDGAPRNLEHLERDRRASSRVPVQYGGGLRSLARCATRSTPAPSA